MVELIAAAKEISAKDWSKLVPLVIQLAKGIYDDYECFKNNGSAIITNKIVPLVFAPKDTQQCVMDHLNAAVGDGKKLVKDVMSFDWNAATTDVNDAIAEIQAALNC